MAQTKVPSQKTVAALRRALAAASPQTYAWWDAAISWGNAVPEMVLLHPAISRAMFESRVEHALRAKVKNRGARYAHDILTLRPGGVRAMLERHRWDVFVTMSRPYHFPSAGYLLDNVRIVVELGLGPSLTWHAKGRRKTMFLPDGNNKAGIAWQADAVRRAKDWTAQEAFELYVRHPTCDVARQLFVRFAQNISPVEGRAIPMQRLGRIRNVELRQAIVRVFGIKKGGAGKPTQADDYGELYPLDDTVSIVHVTCPSTGRDYWLGVPAALTTARQAVLWSFGMEKDVKQSKQFKLLKEA